MPGEVTPQDIAADFMQSLGQDGGNAPAVEAQSVASEQTAMDGGDGLAQFQDAPTDTPDVAALKKQLRQTMTKRTTEIAEERRRIADERRSYEQDRALVQALKQAKDPVKAAEALLGQSQSPAAKTLDAFKDKFDEPTFNALVEMFDVAWKQKWQQEALPQLTPYGNAITQIFGERTTAQEQAAISEFGDGASRWMEEARKFSQQTGVPIRRALITVSDGQVAIDKLRAAVLDKKKREVTTQSVPDNATSKIGLTRNEQREKRNKLIMEIAQKAGGSVAEQFGRP